MSSPAIYAKPKRLATDSLSVKFASAKGAFVYAPVSGNAVQSGGAIVIMSHNGYKHVIHHAHLNRHGAVAAGERIGKATARRIVYRRYNKQGIKVDAMKVVKRSHADPSLYIPGSKRVNPSGAAGVMGPGSERVVDWHTSESGHAPGDILGVANYVTQRQSEYTMLWNPYTGEMVSIFKATDGARSVMNAPGLATNRHGKIRIQICVIGRAADAPLKNSPMKGRRELMEWLDQWGIPRKFTVDPNNPRRDYAKWCQSGHSTHAACPGNDHTDPGAIDVRKLLAP